MLSRVARAALTAALTAAVALALAGSASGAPGNGAQVIVVNECDPILSGAGDLQGTVCTDTRQVFNITETPTGFNVVNNMTFNNSFTGAGVFQGCNTSQEGRNLFTNHIANGDTQANHLKAELHSVFDCGGGGQECFITVHNEIANGEVRFSRSDVNCTPIP
jgi:hypothetical protein